MQERHGERSEQSTPRWPEAKNCQPGANTGHIGSIEEVYGLQTVPAQKGHPAEGLGKERQGPHAWATTGCGRRAKQRVGRFSGYGSAAADAVESRGMR